MIEHGYQCKECGSPAVMKDGVLVRSCGHTGTVIATLEAHVTGNGAVNNGNLQESRANLG